MVDAAAERLGGARRARQQRRHLRAPPDHRDDVRGVAGGLARHARRQPRRRRERDLVRGRAHAPRGRRGGSSTSSSRGAFRGEPDQPAYGASKAGLIAFGQSLARDLGAHGITVTAVAPGFTETDMAAEALAGERGAARRAESPLGRVATPEEVAAAVVFLASPEAELATGTVLDVNGASYLRM